MFGPNYIYDDKYLYGMHHDDSHHYQVRVSMGKGRRMERIQMGQTSQRGGEPTHTNAPSRHVHRCYYYIDAITISTPVKESELQGMG